MGADGGSPHAGAAVGRPPRQRHPGRARQPGDQQLSPSEDNSIEATGDLAFEVLVQNSGDSQETQVEVTLTVLQDPQIKKVQVIDIINPGQTKTVVFRDFGELSFATSTTLQVSVEPVQGETNKDNNTVEYPVIFTVG